MAAVFFHSATASSLPCSLITEGRGCSSSLCCCVQWQQREERSDPGGDGDTRYYLHSSASLTVSPDRAQHLTSDSVSLSCEGNSTEWRVRRLSPENRYLSDCTTWRTMTGTTCKLKSNRLSDAVYWCESGSGEFSNAVNITIQGADAVLEIPEFTLFEGDFVTLRCKNHTQRKMTATFFKEGSPLQIDKNHWSLRTGEITIYPVSVSDEGRYNCKSDDGTESEERELRVKAGRRRVTLTADRTIIPLGGRVTLTCSVEDPAGLKYDWFRQTSDYSGKTSLQTENVYESNKVNSQGGKFTCRGWSSEPDVVTPDSNAVVIEETVPNRATLTLQPNWPQIFSDETITLRCDIKDGEDTEWTYEWSPDKLNTSPTYNEYRIINATEAHSGEYRCKGRRDSYSSTQWSDVIKLTVSYGDMILLSPARPVTEGDSVSLSCKIRRQTFDSVVFFYHNEKLIQNDTRWELNISAVSKSDEGFYKCQHSGQESAQSWMSVQVMSRPENSSVPVLLIVGLICGIVLVIPLLVLFRYRASNDSRFVRPVQSESANTEHVDCQVDHYSTLLHGDVCLYETIRGRQEAEHDSCFVRAVQPESANANCVDYQNDHYSTLLHGDVCLYETIRGRQEAEHGQ